MSQELILNAVEGCCGCAPSEEPWRPRRNTEVTIKNESGSDQIIRNITPGLLTPVQNGRIALIPGETWSGRVASGRGEYTYEGCEDDIENAPRTGTIDPG